jgi:hypothetical protein
MRDQPRLDAVDSNVALRLGHAPYYFLFLNHVRPDREAAEPANRDGGKLREHRFVPPPDLFAAGSENLAVAGFYLRVLRVAAHEGINVAGAQGVEHRIRHVRHTSIIPDLTAPRPRPGVIGEHSHSRRSTVLKRVRRADFARVARVTVRPLR